MRHACLVAFAAIAWGAVMAGPVAAQNDTTAPRARTLVRYADTTSVQLRDVAGYVRVIPENRTDVAVGVARSGVLPAPEFRVSRRRLIVDGKMRRQIRGCNASGGDGFTVQTARQGRLSGEQLPVIEVRVPQNAVVSANGAVRLNMQPAQAATVTLEGCGDAVITRVEDEVAITVSGAQDVRLVEAGSATITLSGAGDIDVGAVREGLTLSVAGSGDFDGARVDGPTSIAVQGSGDVDIRSGHATTLSVVIAGGGDVTHNGSAEQLDAVVLGGGDVHVRHVDGEVRRRVLGGGEVTVGR